MQCFKVNGEEVINIIYLAYKNKWNRLNIYQNANL